MKKYEKPEMEKINFETESIITVSVGGDPDPEGWGPIIKSGAENFWWILGKKRFDLFILK